MKHEKPAQCPLCYSSLEFNVHNYSYRCKQCKDLYEKYYCFYPNEDVRFTSEGMNIYMYLYLKPYNIYVGEQYYTFSSDVSENGEIDKIITLPIFNISCLVKLYNQLKRENRQDDLLEILKNRLEKDEPAFNE